MTITASRRIAAVSVALALPLALLAAPPASAATVGVTDWAGLKAAFLVGGDVVVLNADITAPDNEFLAIDASETIVLDLNGRTLTITNPGNGNAAISVPSDSSFTISATSGGTLTARGGNNGAGIGGGDGRNGGTTIINGGTITSTGGYAGAGIGGGNGGDGGTTIINGGTVTAIAISFAAGIGGGDGGVGTSTVITGGTITASGGQIAAGIGGGAEMDGGVLEVHGTPNAGAATDGGNPVYISTPPAAPITNPLPLPPVV